MWYAIGGAGGFAMRHVSAMRHVARNIGEAYQFLAFGFAPQRGPPCNGGHVDVIVLGWQAGQAGKGGRRGAHPYVPHGMGGEESLQRGQAANKKHVRNQK